MYRTFQSSDVGCQPEFTPERKRSGNFDGGVWVFGYGSLIWRPNFHYDYKVKGRCIGVQRSFCVYSVFHRGTYKQPGLVLGLKRGGICEGMLFHIPAHAVQETMRGLRKREQVTQVYREGFRAVELADGSKERVNALCYVADERHKQFARDLSIQQKAAIIRSARGRSGTNFEYLSATFNHFGQLGIQDNELWRILVLSGRSLHRKHYY